MQRTWCSGVISSAHMQLSLQAPPFFCVWKSFCRLCVVKALSQLLCAGEAEEDEEECPCWDPIARQVHTSP